LIAVVTSLFGGGLELLEPNYAAPDVQLVAFTDDPAIASRWWNVQLVPREHGTTPRRQAKRYKVLVHEYLPHAEYSLWIDSDVALAVDPALLVERHLGDSDVALSPHRRRDCIYEEAKVCAAQGLDAPERIREQIGRYRREGYPPHNGLHACRIVLRRYTPLVRALNQAWWAEIERGSVRDQLSFDYVCWRLGIRPSALTGTGYKNLFRRRRHRTPPMREGLRIERDGAGPPGQGTPPAGTPPGTSRS
jgi:hypothetical protein